MQRSNSGFYAFAAFLIAVASFAYCWKSILPQYIKNEESLAKTNKEIELSKAKLESLQSTKNSLDQLGGLVDQLFIAVPSDVDSPNLITELEAIGTKNQIVIPSIQIGDSTSAAASGNALAVSFTVSGTYENLNKMIAALEKDIRFTNIKSLTYSITPDAKVTTLALQLEVYKRSGSAPAASATVGTAQNGTGVQK